MAKRLIIFSAIVLGCALIVFFYAWRSIEATRVRGRSLPLVAHAGGGIQGQTYTNSLEALDESYRAGFRLFELDFSWTSDNHLVLIHDWEGAYAQFFGMTGTPPTRDQFSELLMKNELTQLSLDQLLQWLAAHPNARIITDMKAKNIDGLAYIAERDPDFAKHFIPQVYAPNEYGAVRALGYTDIILTLYRMNLNRAQDMARLFWFVLRSDLFAVTMPLAKTDGMLVPMMQLIGKPLYAHTVNARAEYDRLRSRGIGIYTDWLTPSAVSTVAPH